MSLSDLLLEVAESLGLPDLRLNPSGVCQLVDGALEVTLEEVPIERVVHLYSVVARVPDHDREAFYARLLEAQLFGREIGENMRFGLEAATQEVLLCQQLSLDGLEAASLISAISQMLNWAEHWQDRLGTPEDAAEMSPEVDPSLGHFIRA